MVANDIRLGTVSYLLLKGLAPFGLKESMFLWKDVSLVLTDSGGLQEETTALGIPCITICSNTERPITLTQGTNILAGISKEDILRELKRFQDGFRKSGRIPELCDGKAAERIVSTLISPN